MSTVYIGIGSNLGDRERNCEYALELLQRNGVTVTKRSSVYETEPWGVKNQPHFLNMAVEIKTDLIPEQLLKVLKQIEKKLGRLQKTRWGPRSIDLDILLFDDIIMEDETLQIPHPFMHNRAFVLRPLHEIAPDIQHPVLKKTVHDLLEELPSEQH